jgi:hypothetical protein
MAALTLRDLRAPNKGRIQVLVNKLILGDKSPFTTNNGSTVGLTKIAFTELGRVKEYKNPSNPREMHDIVTKLQSGSMKAGNVILYNDKIRYTLSDILRTEEFGGKGNRGDMAEIIFSAAITARFINKNSTVSEQDILKLINMIDPNRTQQDFYFKSSNKNENIMDDVHWQINSALINIKAITDAKTQQSLGDIIQSSAKYANSNAVTTWSKLFYENNRYNMISVLAIGAIRQRETKVDVYVEVDKKKIDLNVSLKADQVKQFGQIGGATYEKQELLWATLFDLSPKSYKVEYYNMIKANDPIGAIGAVYKGMVTDINSAISTNRSKVYDSIADGINYFATKSDKSISMVQLSRKEAVVYKFSNLRQVLGLTNIKLKAIYAGKAYPQVDIIDEKGKVLFSIRCKKEHDYIRNYIEKGKLLTELASVLA